MMTPEEAGGRIWRIMDTGLESWWKRRNGGWLGKRMRYSATFAKSKGPFIDRNPKGGKEAVRKGNNPNPPFSYDFD